MVMVVCSECLVVMVMCDVMVMVVCGKCLVLSVLFNSYPMLAIPRKKGMLGRLGSK